MMRVAIIGRTTWLLDSAELLRVRGFEIAAVVTAPAAPEYRVREEDFARLAERCGCPFLLTKSINSVETIQWLREAGPMDLAVSINFTGVIGAEVIGLFRLGILNGHGGDLPRYRGNACQAWALLNGEDRIGMCIHRMIPGELDSGDIMARAFLPVTLNTRIGEVHEWMDAVTPGLVLESAERLAADPAWVLERQSLHPGDSLRCFPRMPADGRIDWRCSAVSVLRLVNASSEPYAGAFCLFGGEMLRIWRADLTPVTGPFCAVPGQVMHIDRTGGAVDVACADGTALRVLEAELHTRGPAALFFRTIRSRLE